MAKYKIGDQVRLISATITEYNYIYEIRYIENNRYYATINTGGHTTRYSIVVFDSCTKKLNEIEKVLYEF